MLRLYKVSYLKFIFRQGGLKLKLRQIYLKTCTQVILKALKISTELHENLCTDQYERAKHEPKINIFIVYM